MRKIKSSSQFMLIPSNGHQKALNWESYKAFCNKLTTKQLKNQYEQHYIDDGKSTNDQLTYSAKKSLISSLNNENLRRAVSHKKMNSQFKITQIRNIQTSIQKRSHPSTLVSDYGFTNNKRSISRQGRFSSMSKRSNFTNKQLLVNNLKKRVQIGASKNARIVGVILMRRFGLRYRFKYCLLQLKHNTKSQEISEQIKKQIPEFQYLNKIPYLFHLGGQPISNLNQSVKNREYVLVVDFSPKLNLQFQAQMQLFDQAAKLQENIRNCQRQIGFSPFKLINQHDQKQRKTSELDQQQSSDSQLNEQNKIEYDWKKISDIKKYVDQIVQNPQKIKNNKNIHLNFTKKPDTKFNKWLEMKFQSAIQQKVNDKNPLFDVSTHYPKQIQSQDIVIKAGIKIQNFQMTKNRHQYKSHFMDNMLQKIKRQTFKQSEEDIKKKRLFDHKVTEKEFIIKLDTKNTLLSEQNIPYIIEKYGINRAEVHNLYSIYKSFEKISAMRNGSQKYMQIFEKGIDRKTFDQGMVKLKINPGQQVIRNICYFPDFIAWEQFIKIISISLRKTPEQKLEAILQGIGGATDGYLTPLQIDVMVGSSILKIFNQEQPQLKEYFVSVVMKQLDPDGDKRVSIETLKQHVLGVHAHEMDIVSFLMLNS